MTRFARAHGSKASNTRVPEEATSWSLMKQQIEECKFQNKNENEGSKSSNANSASGFNVLVKKPSAVNCNDLVWETFDDQHLKSSLSKDSSLECEYNINQSKSKKLNKKLKKKSVKNNGENTQPSNQFKECVKISGNTFSVNSKKGKKQSDQLNETIKSNGVTFINKKVKQSNKEGNKTLPSPKQVVDIERELVDLNKQNKLSPKRKSSCKSSFAGNNIESESTHITAGIDNKTENKIHDDKFTTVRSNKKIKLAEFDNQQHCKPDYFVKEKPAPMNFRNRPTDQSHFQGFPVKKEDADRLYKLRKDLRAKGVPRKTVLATLHAERRKAEKALARDKKVICYKCRQFGHSMSDCPEKEMSREECLSGICFKCGSTEHSAKTCKVVKGDSFKYTRCFICQEQGHISRQCPDNPRGLYPKGGACKICGDVTHLRSDCPTLVNEKEKNRITVGTLNDITIEGLDEEFIEPKKDNHSRKPSIIKF